ncbi:hypothetical protein ACH95_00700 [Bacillus glycinifermentans]|uniref:Uncharacterized protein n=1 Tax=Bacillus glycinifermentans TaxID=1664069 RepID=A0A0J6ESX6_9BACI|nr:hypothetical protein ACH95_00700 [Bacillus glycinifermentans]KRT92145.1 hypothetical protein AB447_204325 [Bacillus glycinifermentans]
MKPRQRVLHDAEYCANSNKLKKAWKIRRSDALFIANESKGFFLFSKRKPFFVIQKTAEGST